MKTIALLLVTVTTLAFAADIVDGLSKRHIQDMQNDGSLTNVINMLVINGTVCGVRGHKWKSGCGIDGCLAIHGGPMRHCLLCGKMEHQTVSEWKQ